MNLSFSYFIFRNKAVSFDRWLQLPIKKNLISICSHEFDRNKLLHFCNNNLFIMFSVSSIAHLKSLPWFTQLFTVNEETVDHYTIIDWWWGQRMICWTWRQNVARGRRPRATFCLKVQHIICCPNSQSIIVLLYLHWFMIKYSIQTIYKNTLTMIKLASIWTNWFGTN